MVIALGRFLANLLGFNHQSKCSGVAGLIEKEIIIYQKIHGVNPDKVIVPKALEAILTEQKMPFFPNRTIIDVEIEYSDINNIICK